ncbi:nuclear transport factor 2 family protein [Leucobacter sp. NPDC058333]|uniref:nuclear transport factor 2 family protein n=1 Tax=Leucobacter sp. NPDC058333 TaxID=3346450 RepID=UPI00364FF8CA
MPPTTPRDAFADHYLATWIEPTHQARSAAVAQLWSPTGTLFVSSINASITGIKLIEAHIGRVHDDLIASKGLTFAYDQQVECVDTVLLRWSMLAPTGDVVGRGIDTVTFTADGLIESVHMFMGVN